MLDLSLRRGMRPEEIADMLGADGNAVMASRDQALDHLASALGATDEEQRDHLRARLAELPSEEWTGMRAPNGTAAAEPIEEPPAVTHEEPAPEPAEPAPAVTAQEPPARPAATAAPAGSRGRGLLVALLLLAIAGVIVAIVLGTSGGGETSSSKPARSKPAAAAPRGAAAKPAAAAVPPGAALAAVGSAAGKANGTVSVKNGRITIAVNGLPNPLRGSYEAWLYNSVIDAQPLGSSPSGNVRISARLPANAKSYQFVDISLEPSDGNPNHSGRSVLRVPLARAGG